MMIMKKVQTAQIAKGIGIGMALGGAVGLAGGALMQPQTQRKAKRNVHSAMKTFSNVLDALS